MYDFASLLFGLPQVYALHACSEHVMPAPETNVTRSRLGASPKSSTSEEPLADADFVEADHDTLDQSGESDLDDRVVCTSGTETN